MIYVLGHSDNDGKYAMFCAWRYYRNMGMHTPEYIQFHKVQYNRPMPLDVETLTKQDIVYVLDFSYPPEILDPVYAKVKQLVVLDHHESAQEYLKGCPYAHFDMTKSGALLAWEYFFPDREPSMVCNLINDRDLWIKQWGDLAAWLHEWIMFDDYDLDWEKWLRLDTCDVAYEDAIEKGRPLFEQTQSLLKAFEANPHNFHIGEAYLTQFPETHKRKTKFILYNGNYTSISELAEYFYTKYPDHMTIDYRVRNNLVTFSCRSPDVNVFNAKQFCMSKGGGGHPRAGSFGLPRQEAFEYINELYNNTAV